jgi:hypothetical protein
MRMFGTASMMQLTVMEKTVRIVRVEWHHKACRFGSVDFACSWIGKTE